MDVLQILSIGGGTGVFAAALALGLRHGIDWDHIAAITDITSSSTATASEEEGWLLGEPGIMLTDESHHHSHSHPQRHTPDAHQGDAIQSEISPGVGTLTLAPPHSGIEVLTHSIPEAHRESIWLGSLYALGHATVVIILGVIAIVAAGFLPAWVDPVMEKLVGVTLVFLAFYLFYSVYRYYQGGGEFKLRSRWM